jgi:Pretoxin HINT domain
LRPIPHEGNTSARTVTARRVNEDTDLTDVTITDRDSRTSTLHTTQHHPFWDETRHAFIDAGQLTVGDELRTPDAKLVKVSNIRSFTGSHAMYNLSVATDHTYYVIAGNTPILVHNCYNPANLGQTYGTNGTVVADPGIRIQGLQGSYRDPNHGINQIINRGVRPEDLLDAQNNPIAVLEQRVGGQTRYVYIGRNAAFTIRPDGELVTAWSTSDYQPMVQQIVNDAQ